MSVHQADLDLMRRVIERDEKERVNGCTFPMGGSQLDGFSLHAAVQIEAGDSSRLEHLCRYITRPPLSSLRLSLTEQGKVVHELRAPFKDGTTHFVFDPLVFIERLAAGSSSKRPTGSFRSRYAGPRLTSRPRACTSSPTTACFLPPLPVAAKSCLAANRLPHPSQPDRVHPPHAHPVPATATPGLS